MTSHLEFILAVYYFVAFAITFRMLINIPTRMSPMDNVIGTFLASMFGFILLPFVIWGVVKIKRSESEL